MPTNGKNLRGFNGTGTHSHNNQCQPMGRISEASMSTGTHAHNYQFQPKGRISRASMSQGHIHITINANQWAESQRLQCHRDTFK